MKLNLYLCQKGAMEQSELIAIPFTEESWAQYCAHYHPGMLLPQEPTPEALARSGPLYVESDRNYEFGVVFDEPALEKVAVTLRINGQEPNSMRVQSMPEMEDRALGYSFESAPFNEVIGNAIIEISLSSTGKPYITLQSVPLAVCIRNGPEARAIETMAQTICQAYDTLLSPQAANDPESSANTRALWTSDAPERDEPRPSGRETLPNSIAYWMKHPAGSLDALSDFVESLLNRWETHFTYFQANARFKMVEKDEIGSFERVRTFNVQTLRHIVQHPEELIASPTHSGIEWHARHYMPKHTLIRSNQPSYDIEEHRVMIGFLKTLHKACTQELSRLETMETALPSLRQTNDDYVSTGELLFRFSEKNFDELKLKWTRLARRVTTICHHYVNCFGLDMMRIPALSHEPRPSTIFWNVPVYRELYELMITWFATPKTNFSAQQALFDSLKSSQIYEMYLQVILLQSLEKLGLTRTKQYHHSYRLRSEHQTQVGNTIINTTLFEGFGARLTVYAQPVLHRTNEPSENALSLVRATGYALLNHEVSYNDRTNYYTPDFLIKLENASGTTYYIVDAKYSVPESIIRYQVPELVYKYLFGIRATQPNETIEGLWLLCGKLRSNSASMGRSSAFIDEGALGPQLRVESVTALSPIEGSQLLESIQRRLMGESALNAGVSEERRDPMRTH